MIRVDGAKMELAGSDTLLMDELAYAIAAIRSRINSKGFNDACADTEVIAPAATNAKLYTLEHLRSEAKMRAEAERTRKGVLI